MKNSITSKPANLSTQGTPSTLNTSIIKTMYLPNF